MALYAYRKRDDLPMLTLPLALLLFAAVCGCTVAAAAVMREGVVSGSRIPGFLAGIPLCCLAVSGYGTLILLWRRAASMTVTVASVVLLFSFAGWSMALTLCLSIYVSAYTYASAFLMRKSRFLRTFQLTAAAAVCLVAAGVLYVGTAWRNVSFSALPGELTAAMTAQIQKSTLFSGTTEEAAALARSLWIALPAMWLITAECAAGLCEWLCCRLFRIMECERYFLPEADEGITTPRRFGVTALVLYFLLLATSYDKNPLLYAVLQNCVLTLYPPTVYVGAREAAFRLRDRLTDAYLIGRGRRGQNLILTVTLLLWGSALLGLGTVCFLLALYGAWRVVRNHPDTLGKNAG